MSGEALVSALLVGLAVGVVGRLVLPGRRATPVWLTIAAGIAAALLGTIGIRLAGAGLDAEAGPRLLVQGGSAVVATLLAVRAAAARRPADPAWRRAPGPVDRREPRRLRSVPRG
ncbi:hypothetical protein K7640_01195 [Micromonospora sp. PLK6-60]|uniref:hypothetical protein n=1 Tax=Micromonospora sp. PLK6-60 TaxID=2873383 RepID=UPI001CA62B04|nr:hypothetical protein [Micromonospora sp. PLK6-60]MBY8870455.1 hypothetical protein [Micromonospora sp. PLK6-60]